MTIQDDISADKVKLAEDEAKLAAIQPHLSILQEIENEMATLEEGIKSRVTSLVASLRAKLNQ